ncbi:hypothetical protein C0991_000780 [Blastosporella zonata]|nr:hypothetical protein C0991_000780 [Blastosporella zonata]
MKRTVNNDPLTLAMAPPPDETPEERLAREDKEERARQVSKRIDLELKHAKAAMKSMERAVKVLVLGQSMSDFQMTYAQKSWAEERDSWKTVILLNLVRSVNMVVDVIREEFRTTTPTAHRNVEQDREHGGPHDGLTEYHNNLILKLVPLRQIERDLEVLLGSGSLECDGTANLHERSRQEFSLRSSSGWKTVLDHIRNPNGGKDQMLLPLASEVAVSLKDDIRGLWNDTVVQTVLRKHRIWLEDSPGFFLHDVDRIASPDYVPSDADVVRARLRTTGVQEYHFFLDRGTATALDWLMYDVAGIRTSRAAWIPYFKNITAIIFLAPMSAFNETLAEDPTTNSVHDSLSLWQTVCSSKLLANVQIILFMNKTDLLQKKLDSGLVVHDYLPEYKEKGNDFVTVTTCSFSRCPP